MKLGKSLVALSLSFALAGTVALAQPYPAKPVKIIVPFPPGGIADATARTIANHLSETWGKPFLVESRPGAGTILGIMAVVKAPADGYTLLYATTNIATNPGIYANLPYDATRDLVPVALAVVAPGAIVVHPSFSARTLAELIALAKEKPELLTYSSAGVGSYPHLALEQFQQLSGTKLTHVPYKGFAPALMAVLGNEVTVFASDLQTALPHLKAGKVRALAVTAAKRMRALPDVAPVADLGLADYEAVSWAGIMAPAGTPREIVLKLNAEIIRGLNQPQTATRFEENGVEPGTGSPEDFGAYVQHSRTRWAGVIRKGGIKGDQ